MYELLDSTLFFWSLCYALPALAVGYLSDEVYEVHAQIEGYEVSSVKKFFFILMSAALWPIVLVIAFSGKKK